MSFDWSAARSAFDGFGGTPVSLRIPKTGLPFFDALRLYGAIDLYIGLREETSIHDAGAEWVVEGLCREHRTKGKALAAVNRVSKSKKPSPEAFWRLAGGVLEVGPANPGGSAGEGGQGACRR